MDLEQLNAPYSFGAYIEEELSESQTLFNSRNYYFKYILSALNKDTSLTWLTIKYKMWKLSATKISQDENSNDISYFPKIFSLHSRTMHNRIPLIQTFPLNWIFYWSGNVIISCLPPFIQSFKLIPSVWTPYNFLPFHKKYYRRNHYPYVKAKL